MEFIKKNLKWIFIPIILGLILASLNWVIIYLSLLADRPYIDNLTRNTLLFVLMGLGLYSLPLLYTFLLDIDEKRKKIYTAGLIVFLSLGICFSVLIALYALGYYGSAVYYKLFRAGNEIISLYLLTFPFTIFFKIRLKKEEEKTDDK